MPPSNQPQVAGGENNASLGEETVPSELACRRRSLVRGTTMLTVTWDWNVVGDRIFREGLVVIKIDAGRRRINRCEMRRGLKMTS